MNNNTSDHQNQESSISIKKEMFSADKFGSGDILPGQLIADLKSPSPAPIQTQQIQQQQPQKKAQSNINLNDEMSQLVNSDVSRNAIPKPMVIRQAEEKQKIEAQRPKLRDRDCERERKRYYENQASAKINPEYNKKNNVRHKNDEQKEEEKDQEQDQIK